MDQKQIGSFLKELRKEKSITQEQLAEHLNVSGRTVSRWETGSNMPDISLLVELSEFYDVSIPEIINGERKSENMNEEVREVAETIKANKEDIFIKAQEKSTLNIFAVVGDWMINPSKKGFLTNPSMTNGDIQRKFLDKTIDYVKSLLGKGANFSALFTMGNHDLDGGDGFIYKVMRGPKKKTLVTNVDIDNSYANLSQNKALEKAKNDTRLEKLSGSSKWSVANTFRTDIPYAKKG